MTKTIRVRFAPAPTGMMHLGNIRTVLMNYLIARQKQGTFVLRIEDTDAERNYDPQAQKIQEDLSWLSLFHDEGPGKGGPYGPYFQSQRNILYQEKLQELIDLGHAYRCFCTTEELDKKRSRQIALKLPPRYDQTCRKLDAHTSAEQAQSIPFIWRMHLDDKDTLSIVDLAHGTVTFEMKNFSDFALTRQDGTVTFLFANFVDDALMKITHVIRGEDHLSNTACQAALYKAMKYELPVFWHLPILCNSEGKKLSKRDFGFSLRDLKDAGFLPEAIINYLGIIGGSFKDEIMTLEQLVQVIDFENIHTTGQIRYDVEKLRWVNHKWICSLPISKLIPLCRPYLENSYPQAASLSDDQLSLAIESIYQEMVTLQDCIQLLAFYFTKPLWEKDIARSLVTTDHHVHCVSLITSIIPIQDAHIFVTDLKSKIKESGIPTKQVFGFIRYALTGSHGGPAIETLISLLGKQETTDRLMATLSFIK